MKTQIIVNRINDWFRIDDLELNIYMLSMRILLKLTTRRHAGLAYDRVNLAMGILNRTSIEAIETLDKAIQVFRDLYEMAEQDAEKLHNAPVKTPVTRLDEVGAARHPVLKYEFSK